ncbi:MAG TPA: ATP-binding cassette domain-containing protein [Chloroflexota bacterium]|nr:ATP-binding cassette domain-containing protein [Chloroflexota bacterium]
MLAKHPITVQNLRKVYRVHEREEGLGATVRSLFHRRFREIPAVDGISFSIEAGEVVGFLGPNGAGKTTTLKMLSGLIHPSEGEVDVLGYQPWRRQDDFLRQITLVMGNRSQLFWDIPAADSLRVLQEIYRLPDRQYRKTLDDLTDLLDLGALLHKPVRNLSLGERMKVEFAAALIHLPRVVFLDEPTIGLDVTMQSRIRRFIADYNRRAEATILLTSHYMDDVVALCKRVVVIHRGRLRYDGGLTDLAGQMAPYKLIALQFAEAVPAALLARYGEVASAEEERVVLRVPREGAPEAAARLVRDFQSRLADFSVEDPPIEEVIDRVFSGERIPAAAAPGPAAGAP